MGSLRPIPFTRIDDVTFRVYTDEEIEKLSVVNIYNETSVNSLGHFLDYGIYDLRMGPMNANNSSCTTCKKQFFLCSGHCGHIDLPLPVCNPFFYDNLKVLLQRICPTCYLFQVDGPRGIQFVYEQMIASAGYDLQALDVKKIVDDYLDNPDEAIEEPRSYNKHDGILRLNHNLTKKLKKFFDHIKKDDEAAKVTSTSQATYISIQKQFISDTKVDKCVHCKKNLMKVKFRYSRIELDYAKNKLKEGEEEKKPAKKSIISDAQPFLTPIQAQTILRECYKKDGLIMRSLYPFLNDSKLEHPTDMFFMQKLIVIPPKYRPLNQLRGNILENETNMLYKSVCRFSKCLRFLKQYKENMESEIPDAVRYLLASFKGRDAVEKSHYVWQELQAAIDNLLDSEICSEVSRVSNFGIRQIIEKKMGLFRRNLMGKRVNFSARSVAAPDPMLSIDEVGVPEQFALKLTYPIPVTPWNVPKLRKLVENGPNIYPGALWVEDEEGKKITLKPNDPTQRSAIAKALLTPAESCVKKVNATKIVYRHLLSGDYVLMNRQPTLHKPSIQAHKARIMRNDRVLRLPYACCKAYNADFDGDELNLHFPQNEMARSEARHIITTDNQYLNSKDGSPIAGLIQDCVVASVMLTMRGKFFSVEDYQQLVFVSVRDIPRKICLLQPSILKPEKLWSGKQIISTILHNLIPKGEPKPSFTFKTAVKADMWIQEDPREWRGGGTPEKKRESMTESEFVMRDGELLSGVVDKCAIGSTSFGLVHTCYELYGGAVASQVLTAVNRLCVIYLQWVGHTISLKEFITPPKAAKKRRKELKKLIERTEREVSAKVGVEMGDLPRHLEFLHRTDNENEISVVDAAYTSVLGPVTSTITSENEKKLYRNNLKNRMRMMVDTGAKGSKVNMNQMASLFGSVALDGKRMPRSITGKTLPSFKPYECNPRAGGYIPTRFVTGMDPQSYFFLCIVGRDSLQHTAVKTANSGYMQRCLIKHLEGIRVKYDMTVRNSDNLVLQFDYGEDGLDVCKVPYFSNFDSLDTLLNFYNKKVNRGSFDGSLSPEAHQIDLRKKWARKYKKAKRDVRTSGFLKFYKQERDSFESAEGDFSYKGDESNRYGRSKKTLQMLEYWHNMGQEERASYESSEVKLRRGRDPVASTYCGSLHFGVVSEALDSLIEEYYDKRYSLRRSEEQNLSKEMVTNVLYSRFRQSRVDPGEAVGALCAQAIGEPLTQMTLNTFHFAGRDELNVTLGVPRMIEILRTASEKNSTPIMEVPFKPHVTASLAEKLRMKLTPVPLDKVLHKVTFTTSLEKQGNILRRVECLFSFLPHKEYKKTFFIRPKEVLRFMEKYFFKNYFLKVLKAAARQQGNPDVDYRKEKNEVGKGDVEVDNLETVVSTRGLEESDSENEQDELQEQQADTGLSSSSRVQKAREMDYSEDEEEEVEIDRVVVKVEEELEEEMRSKYNPMKNPLANIVASDEEGMSEEEVEIKEEAPSPKQTPIGRQSPTVKDIRNMNKRKMRINYVVNMDRWISDYDFDQENNLWCKITLDLPFADSSYDLATVTQKAARIALVHSFANIKKAFVVQKEDHLLLKTEGVNIQKMYSFENFLDVKRLYTNNIYLMSQMYGIEAAQRCIIKEIQAVQSAYDIKVDFRHLSLLADYFTCEGSYKACSRHFIDSCVSPIQKMSYETCFQFLKKALLQGMPDTMCSPSANVMVGQPVKVGTNSMDILSKLTVNSY